MMGTKTITQTDAPVHPASTQWTPRAVRCAHCGGLAREEVRERISDDEVVVRYGCSACRWRVTRHFMEDEAR
jgi:lysyl-tRNA synthetase class I